MRVETLYTDSSGTYRIRADVKENNRSVHIIEIRDDDYGTEADVDDFTDEEQVTITNLVLEEYDALTTEPADAERDYEFDEEEDPSDPPDDY